MLVKELVKSGNPAQARSGELDQVGAPDQAPDVEPDLTAHPVLGAEEVWGTPGPPVNDPKVELPEGVVLRFQRSGGFAGLYKEWLFYSSGKITRNESSWQVSPEQVETLLAQIDELGFFTARVSSSPGFSGSDRMSYSLSVDYKGLRRTISAVEGARGVPQQFWEAVNAVQAMLLETAQ